MSKYSSEFKLEVVKYYLENNAGYQTAGKYFCVSPTLVRRWIRKYKENGYAGLMKNQKSSYGGDFKQNVVEYMHKSHDLLYLAEKVNLELNERQEDLLDIITRFNMNARYDDYKKEFYKRCTNEYTLEQIKNIEGVRKWLKELLATN